MPRPSPLSPPPASCQTLAALNFEGKNSYKVTVSASDRKDATGNADTAIDATIDVTISVTNVDEPGTVIFSPAQPRVGEALRARGERSGRSCGWLRYLGLA